MSRVIETIPSAAMDVLSRYHWPGNIRELQNVIERAVIISAGPVLNVDVTDLNFPRLALRRKNPLLRNRQMAHCTTFWRKRNVNRFLKLLGNAIGLWPVQTAQRHILQ